MPKFITETNSVICIDDEYIDTNEIAHVGKITQVKYGTPASSVVDEFSFSIMLKGHSNVLHFQSPTEIEACMKRKFIIQSWASEDEDEILSFEDLIESFEEDIDETDEDMN